MSELCSPFFFWGNSGVISINYDDDTYLLNIETLLEVLSLLESVQKTYHFTCHKSCSPNTNFLFDVHLCTFIYINWGKTCQNFPWIWQIMQIHKSKKHRKAMCVKVLISNIPKIVLTFQFQQMKLSSTNPNFLSYFLPCSYQYQTNKLLQAHKFTSIYEKI